MNRPFIPFALSAALGGFAVALISPTAHGHGNNPRKSAHWGPVEPWISDGEDEQETSAPFDPGFLIDVLELTTPLDVSAFTGEPDTALSTDLLLEPQVIEPLVDLDAASTMQPMLDGVFGRRPGPMVPGNVFGPRMIPAPGSLALIGLAALLARRRRRRP